MNKIVMTKRQGFCRMSAATKLKLAEARKKAAELRKSVIIEQQQQLPPTEEVIKKSEIEQQKPIPPKEKEIKKPKNRPPPKVNANFDFENSRKMRKWWRTHLIEKASKKAVFLERMQVGRAKARQASLVATSSNDTGRSCSNHSIPDDNDDDNAPVESSGV